jgi:phage terminase small subunit
MAKNQYDELTDRQKKFAEYYHELSNGTKAAILAGYGEAGAHTEASRQLKNVKVKDYLAQLETERRERVQSRLATMAEKAAELAFELAQSAESESVRMQALKDIMDRAGYKPTDKVEQKTDMDAKISFGFVDPNGE